MGFTNPALFGMKNNQPQIDMGYGYNGDLDDPTGLLGIGNYGVTGPTAVAEAASAATPLVGTGGNSIWDSFLPTKLADGSTTGGYGSVGLGLAQGLASAWMGMKQYGLAKDQLAFQKDAFNKNYTAQAQTTNTALEDRQRARVASNPGAYQSVGDYMNENRIV